jgi:tetratricopeptide (TPR) repeat protein
MPHPDVLLGGAQTVRPAIRGHTVLVVLLLVWIAPRASAQPYDALEKGLRLQQQGKNEEAGRVLRRLLPSLRASPDRKQLASALSSLADASMTLGDYESAARDALEAASAPPQDDALESRCAVSAAWRHGGPARAVRAFEDGRDDAGPEEAQLLINEGALFRRLGDPVKALEAYRRARELFAAARHRDGEIGAWRTQSVRKSDFTRAAPMPAPTYGDQRPAPQRY